MVKRK
jgi:glycerophosphoryl diester phosphodiesterase